MLARLRLVKPMKSHFIREFCLLAKNTIDLPDSGPAFWFVLHDDGKVTRMTTQTRKMINHKKLLRLATEKTSVSARKARSAGDV
jgi:hypothetical protein